MRRPAVSDVVLSVAGVLMGWHTVLFPFGRDQALYYYVAREWAEGRGVPYKDVFDHKTPGIYMMYALGIRLFGETLWGIRVLDIVAVLMTGLVASAVVLPRGEKVPDGFRGLGVLCAGIFFFGILTYWDTAQSEIYYSLLGLSSVWAIRRLQSERRAQIVAGAFAGAAIVMKPTSMWLVFVAILLLVRRVRESAEGVRPRLFRGLGFFAAGGAATVLPVLLYFAAHGALGALYEIAVKANSYYVSHETNIQSPTSIPIRIWEYFAYYNPISTLCLGGTIVALIVARKTKDKALHERHLLGLILCSAAFLAVFMQVKFYMLHWTVMIGPATVVFLNLALDVDLLTRKAEIRRPFLVVLAALIVPYVLTERRMREWYNRSELAALYALGKVPHDEWVRAFDITGFYSHADSERTGLWIAERTQPTDTIAVRGFEPQIYLFADRRYGGRHFWTLFITSANRESVAKRAVWEREDKNYLEAHPPKYVVTLTGKNGPDGKAYFLPLGYEERIVFGDYTILEKRSVAR